MTAYPQRPDPADVDAAVESVGPSPGSQTRPGAVGAPIPAGLTGLPTAESAETADPAVSGVIVEAMDQLSQHLSMAGLRMAALRRRLADPDDRILLSQATDELDEAITVIRRFALITRQVPDA